jgi:hypothetical protein
LLGHAAGLLGLTRSRRARLLRDTATLDRRSSVLCLHLRVLPLSQYDGEIAP